MKGLRKPASEGYKAREAAAKVALHQYIRDLYLKKENAEELQEVLLGVSKLWKSEINRHLKCSFCLKKSFRGDKLAFFQNGTPATQIFAHKRCGLKAGGQLLMAIKVQTKLLEVDINSIHHFAK